MFWIGASLEPWLDSSLGTLAPGAQTAALLDVPGTVVLPFRTGATFAEDFGDSDPDHDHDHGTIDPHAWLDPENGKVWLDAIAIAIAVALSRIDPDNAATYAANAVSGQAEIDAPSADISITLAPLAGLRFVVFHDACQYFERRFDLPATGAISLGDASAPSSARIRALRD